MADMWSEEKESQLIDLWRAPSSSLFFYGLIYTRFVLLIKLRFFVVILDEFEGKPHASS